MALTTEPVYVMGYRTSDGEIFQGPKGYDEALVHQKKVDLADWIANRQHLITDMPAMALADMLLGAYNMQPKEVERAEEVPKPKPYDDYKTADTLPTPLTDEHKCTNCGTLHGRFESMCPQCGHVNDDIPF